MEDLSISYYASLIEWGFSLISHCVENLRCGIFSSPILQHLKWSKWGYFKIHEMWVLFLFAIRTNLACLLTVWFLKYNFAVVYLDADTIVVKSIEDLFKCGKFCANLKHSERLNSGVMVLEPSETIFNDMMSKVTTLPSYTGGKAFLCASLLLLNKF